MTARTCLLFSLLFSLGSGLSSAQESAPVVPETPNTVESVDGVDSPKETSGEETKATPEATTTAPENATTETANAVAEGTAPDTAAAEPAKEEKKKGMLEKFMPILILLIVVGFVLNRLPRVEGVEHSAAYRRRRVMNWLPLGFTYAFLYMARYNIKVSQHAFEDMHTASGASLMTNADFATIFFWGTLTYGCSFIINGPLTDRYGGKFSILMGAAGSAVMNLVMGLVTWQIVSGGAYAEYCMENLTVIFSVLYAINMYFQSFGAVAIVKCNAPWFHLRERGVFGAIFGILISLGIYFAFDVGYMIIENFELQYVFLVPTVLLAIFFVLDVFMVRNTPGDAGFADFDTADATNEDESEQLGAAAVFKMMLSNPVILTIACIEFCSGFLRQAIMQWFRSFAKQTDDVLHLKDSFVYDNWGMLLCCAGIMGGVFAGVISDRVFQSRRGPVAGVLYGGMLLGGIVMAFTYKTAMLPWLVVFMSMCIIGVHGMLSGTASMDFGGKKNVGVAVGIIDGFVYAGTAVMAFVYGIILPDSSTDAAGDPSNWIWWPVSMIPIAALGLFLSLKVWNAKPKTKKSAAAAE